MFFILKAVIILIFISKSAGLKVFSLFYKRNRNIDTVVSCIPNAIH